MKKLMKELQVSNPPQLEKNFSLFTSHFSLKRRAFTLAEVLITLGIIGIVAALTMPMLISNYKKHEVEVKLQRVFSVLSQAVQLATIDYGNPIEWEIKKDNKGYTASYIATKYFMPYIQDEIHISSDELFRYEIIRPNGTIGLGGGNHTYAFKLKSGEIINIHDRYKDESEKQNFVTISVFLKQNKNDKYLAGKDYFSLLLDINNGIITSKLNSKTTIYDMDDCITYGRCASLIQTNNWKIPDNYPVKF